MIESFLPIITTDTKILILGTMPGQISLNRQEYYGNKNNHFWRIMFSVFNEHNAINDYDAKIQLLQDNNIGLWDTLQHCERQGSLDIHIKNHQVNNFDHLFTQFPNIKKVLFNGKDSHKFFFKQYGQIEGIRYFIMPSTSPANTMTFEKKLAFWKEAIYK
ncbi:MAG TPA: DNA-deoxyinosine glycosylase [Flavobacterium sp.]